MTVDNIRALAQDNDQKKASEKKEKRKHQGGKYVLAEEYRKSLALRSTRSNRSFLCQFQGLDSKLKSLD